MAIVQGPGGRRATSFHFADFELRLDSGELWRAGVAVKLQPRPASVLEILAGRTGEVVPRQEIRSAVWGDETYVDFDLALNFCILQIRRALGDSAVRPRFVATIPRRGYRFLAPVRVVSREVGAPVIGQTAAPRKPAVRWRSAFAGVGALGLLLITLGLVVRQHRPWPPGAAAPAQVSPAHQLYLQGQYREAWGEIDQAKASFEEAARLDPRSAPAFAALGQVLLATCRPAREVLTAAEAAERRALELDPKNFVAYVDRGQRLFQYEYDWRGAESEFRRAVQLDGRSAEGHYGLANVLAQQGRHDEALAEANRALALEPERRLAINLAWFYYLARRHDDAIAQARRTIELAFAATRGVTFPKAGFQQVFWTLILAELAKADAQAALNTARDEARAMAIRPPASLAEFWARAKRDAAKADSANLGYAVVPAIELGEYDHAIDLLYRQCEERSGSGIPFLRVNPLYDPLRGLPRFAALLRCARLAASRPTPAPAIPARPQRFSAPVGCSGQSPGRPVPDGRGRQISSQTRPREVSPACDRASSGKMCGLAISSGAAAAASASSLPLGAGLPESSAAITAAGTSAPGSASGTGTSSTLPPGSAGIGAPALPGIAPELPDPAAHGVAAGSSRVRSPYSEPAPGNAGSWGSEAPLAGAGSADAVSPGPPAPSRPRDIPAPPVAPPSAGGLSA
jgi:DNA-binding winged helix-turn-helix (wHTH) protein/Tfp pilus assembly protein PilF